MRSLTYGFLSTPSARRATTRAMRKRAGHNISIHALREEGDGGHHRRVPYLLDFYPRPPRGGRRFDPEALTALRKFLSTPSARRATATAKKSNCNAKFLSTPSARRATFVGGYAGSSPPRFLSTPSARRATVLQNRPVSGLSNFYPRPPRGGRRMDIWDKDDEDIFLSTPSARRATWTFLMF